MREAGVIGAAHAGWKGALAGVLENTVAAMESWAPSAADRRRHRPTISQANYEVGEDLGPIRRGRRALLRRLGSRGSFSLRSARLCRQRLRLAGVGQVDDIAALHLSAGERFFLLPPHHPSGRGRLWPGNFGYCARVWSKRRLRSAGCARAAYKRGCRTQKASPNFNCVGARTR